MNLHGDHGELSSVKHQQSMISLNVIGLLAEGKEREREDIELIEYRMVLG